MTLEESILTLSRSIDALVAAYNGKPAEIKAGKPGRPLKAPVSEPKYEDVREAILAFSERHGMSAAVTLLSELGVTHAKELKREQYREALDKCQAA